MKRILLALTVLCLLFSASRRADAEVQVSLDFFYDNLGGGSWIEVDNYGYCWQPGVAVSSSGWRPYADGYWAYTDLGWTWVSYEDFGWATYHYGRWADLDGHGWVWVPGYDWGPAWVSWRTGGDYVGWAPLPPGGEPIYEGRPIGGRVDVEFDIGPLYYNFVDIRYIGAPVLREHIYEPQRNITIINNTVNVTNITYNNSVVYNYGPEYETMSRYSARPIQRLKLERKKDMDPGQALQAGMMTKVQGDKLVVGAPNKLGKANRKMAPKQIKNTVKEPKLQRGWAGIDDQNVRKKLRQKMEKEDSKNIPPPTIEPRGGADAQVGASPGGVDAGADASADVAKQGKKNKQEKQGGKNRGRNDGPPTGDASEALDSSAATEADANVGAGQGKKARKAAKQEALENKLGRKAGGNQEEQSQSGEENQSVNKPGKKAQRRLQGPEGIPGEANQPSLNEARPIQPLEQGNRGQKKARRQMQESAAPMNPDGGLLQESNAGPGGGPSNKAQRRMERQQQQRIQQVPQRQVQPQGQPQGQQQEEQGQGRGKKKQRKQQEEEALSLP